MIGGLRRTMLRLAALVRARALDRDLDDELDAHLALAEEEHVRRGLTRDDARRRTRVELGGLLAAKERQRQARSLQRIEGAFQDVGYAVRAIRRHRASSLIVVLILALGIGVNTAVFQHRPSPDPQSLRIAARPCRPSTRISLRPTCGLWRT